MAESSSKAMSLRELDSPEKLTSLLRLLRNARYELEGDWRLNLAFYRGEQWTWFNRKTNQIQALPTDDGEKPRYRVRLTSNLILPNVNAYVAQLSKTKPIIYATPDSSSERDIRAAQTAQDLNEHWWRSLYLKDRYYEALLWATLASNGWWNISWDPYAGKKMKVLLGPDGQPFFGPDDLRDLFLQQMAQMGVQPIETMIPMGEIKVEALSPLQVYVDPAAKILPEARYAICIHPTDPDEVQERYGVWLPPDASSVDTDITRPWRKNYGKPARNMLKNIYHGYFIPSPVLPEGRYVIWAEGHSDFLYDGPWDYPVDEIPLVQFPGIRVPGSIDGEAITTHARPMQKEINKLISQVVAHHNLTMAPQWIAAHGMFNGTRMTNEPGAINYYNPVNGMEPSPVQYPPIQPYVFDHLREMQMRIDRLYNLQAVTRGDVPPNVEAGTAIDFLQEAAVDQISPQIQMLEESLARAGMLMSALAQRYYIEPRTLKITGEGGVTRVRDFMQADIQGNFSFHAEAGSGLPRTRAGRIARIEQLVGMQIIHPAMAWKHLDIADLKGIASTFAADEEQALRENERMLHGLPVNEIAVAQAMQAVQAGVNPMTGQPLQSPQEAQQIVQGASLAPLPYENKTVHLQVHALKMKSPEFESLPVEIRMAYQQHFQLTQQALQSEAPKDPRESPRTSLQLRGTLGPTVAAKILSQNNVPARPEEFLEVPLETMVIDSVDKPDVEAAGNDPLDEYEQIQRVQQAELEHYLKAARMAHEVELARSRASETGQGGPPTVHQDVLKESQTVQKLRNDQEAHDQKMRQNEETHQARMRQARKSASGKPKS